MQKFFCGHTSRVKISDFVTNLRLPKFEGLILYFRVYLAPTPLECITPLHMHTQGNNHLKHHETVMNIFANTHMIEV